MTRHRADRGAMIVATIADYHATYGYGPTVRELGERVGLASTSAVVYHLTQLRDAGRVTWEPGIARTLAVAGTDTAAALVKAVHDDGGVGYLSAPVQDRLAAFVRARL